MAWWYDKACREVGTKLFNLCSYLSSGVFRSEEDPVYQHRRRKKSFRRIYLSGLQDPYPLQVPDRMDNINASPQWEAE